MLQRRTTRGRRCTLKITELGQDRFWEQFRWLGTPSCIAPKARRVVASVNLHRFCNKNLRYPYKIETALPFFSAMQSRIPLRSSTHLFPAQMHIPANKDSARRPSSLAPPHLNTAKGPRHKT